MPKTVMVFGAGINQLTLIDAVNDLGYRSLVIDPSPNPPGKARAQLFLQIAKDDYDATRQAAIDHNVAGIVTGQMENPLKMMARLSQEMGYIFHSPEVIERSTNKFLMKQAFQKNGIPCANGKLINDVRILSREELDEFAYPVIIKPLSAFSSRGVYRIEKYQDYLDKIGTTLNFSNDGRYLIEDFIEGPEYSVETITYQGNTTIIQYTEKLITPYPNTVEIGHIQPADLSEAQKSEISEVVIKAIKSLDIDNSAAHTELKLSSHGPIIIEIGARMGGDFISSYLVRESTGINMEREAVRVALGMEPDFSNGCQAAAAIMYLLLPPGACIAKVHDSNSQIGDGGLVMSDLSVSSGDVVEPVTDSSKRSGWIIVKGRNYTEVLSVAQQELRKLRERVEIA